MEEYYSLMKNNKIVKYINLSYSLKLNLYFYYLIIVSFFPISKSLSRRSFHLMSCSSHINKAFKFIII